MTNSEKVLAHYVGLAKEPGWKQYVWGRINDLATEHPETYGELPKLLTEAMREVDPAISAER
jgi:hypothetical protein